MNVTPDLVRRARANAGLNAAQAAALVEVGINQWLDWECGGARMPYPLYELFLVKVRAWKEKSGQRRRIG